MAFITDDLNTSNQVFVWFRFISVLILAIESLYYICMLCGLTFNVMSSEQEASKLPVGSHLMAFTSFYKIKTLLSCEDMYLKTITNFHQMLQWVTFRIHISYPTMLQVQECIQKVSLSLPVRKHTHTHTVVLSYRVSLEGLDRSVLTQLTHMDAHVCAAGGKRVVALPVYVQSRCCWGAETEFRAAAAVR